jgi:large subunit ribosomal protein L3
MANFILAKKIKMSQLFDEQGRVIPVTLVQAGPCFVTQVKNLEKDGYQAIQFGFEKIEKANKIKKTMKDKAFRYLREFREGKKRPQAEEKEIKVGDKIDVSLFQIGEKIRVRGLSKGKGFAGAVKRWGFVDKAKAHGAKDMRRLGSIGSRFPQRTIKGKKMAGRMGSRGTTVKNLKIIKIDKDNNLLFINGALPGKKGALLEIRS